jgi:two-component system, cell cycle response regulator
MKQVVQMGVRYELSVLFVEDEEMIIETMGGYLKRRFQELHHAANGEEGLAKFIELHPDIVVSDIEMPRMDGLEMCAAIKKISPDTPFIFTTAFSEPEQLEAANKLGVFAYLVKPINYEELESAIADIIVKRAQN